jgi:hypothetical protein
LDFRLSDGGAQYLDYDEKFTEIVGVARLSSNALFSNVEIGGESDKLILSSSNNTYCGLGAKRYFGYIYIFGHESPLQLNPELVSAVFFETLPESVRKEIAAMDLKFKNDLEELQKPFNELLNQYMEQLRLDKVQYQQAGNLDAALAHEQEIEEVRPKDSEKSPEWHAPEDPIIIKKRQGFMSKHAEILSRNFDAAIALARGYAEQLNALIVERTKGGKLQEAQAFQSRLDDLRTTMTIYRQMDKSVVEMSAWVKETLEWMPERPQSAGGALPSFNSRPSGVQESTAKNADQTKTGKKSQTESTGKLFRGHESKDRKNVYWQRDFSLFDMLTDEEIHPTNVNGRLIYRIYYASNERPFLQYGEFDAESLEKLLYYKFKTKKSCLEFCNSRKK